MKEPKLVYRRQSFALAILLFVGFTCKPKTQISKEAVEPTR